MIKPTALLESRDMFVMFDGCPTCKWQDAGYLVGDDETEEEEEPNEH